jgi:hypothetical protein
MMACIYGESRVHSFNYEVQCEGCMGLDHGR